MMWFRSAITIFCLQFLLWLTYLSSTGHAEPGNLFDSNGVKIHYLDQGQGEPVLLVHGFAASGVLNWSLPGIIQSLRKQDYRVITIDNRGHGQSEKPHDPEKYGVEMVGDLTRLLDHLRISKAHVVGYSMGAFLTCKMLTVAPDRMISATLGGAGWPRENDPRLNLMTDLAQSLESGNGIVPLLRALAPPERPQPTDDQLQSISRLALLVNDPLALAAVARSNRQLLVNRSSLEKNKVPVLGLVGQLDPLKDSVDALVGVLPELEVAVIPGADHDTAFTHAQFKSELVEFLAKHRQAASSANRRN